LLAGKKAAFPGKQEVLIILWHYDYRFKDSLFMDRLQNCLEGFVFLTDCNGEMRKGENIVDMRESFTYNLRTKN